MVERIAKYNAVIIEYTMDLDDFEEFKTNELEFLIVSTINNKITIKVIYKCSNNI